MLDSDCWDVCSLDSWDMRSSAFLIIASQRKREELSVALSLGIVV